MAKLKDTRYSIAGRRLIAETPELRVQILTLESHEEIPWHYHSVITDTFICLDGPMVISTRAPSAVHNLKSGEIFSIPPDIAHRISGMEGSGCRFVIVQGTGAYDYFAVNS